MARRVLAITVTGLLPLALAGCASYPRIGGYQTTGLEWLLGFLIFIAYLCAVFTIAVLTFRKGHTALGCLGFFLPILWLIGAILPAKRGSIAYINEGRRQADQISEYSK